MLIQPAVFFNIISSIRNYGKTFISVITGFLTNMWKSKINRPMKLDIKAGQYDLLMEMSAAFLQKMSNTSDR